VTGPESAARLQILKIDGAHNDTPRLDHDRCRTGDMCSSWAESSDSSNFSPHPYRRDRQGNLPTGGQGREPSARLGRFVDCCLPSSVGTSALIADPRAIEADGRRQGVTRS
jgi:hypothetical protein